MKLDFKEIDLIIEHHSDLCRSLEKVKTEFLKLEKNLSKKNYNSDFKILHDSLKKHLFQFHVRQYCTSSEIMNAYKKAGKTIFDH